MLRRCTLVMGAGVIALGLLVSPGVARDPGDTPTRAGGSSGSSSSSPRGGSNDGFVPERVDRDELHPPTRVDAPEPPLYQRVESDVDRGRGRIEDEQTLRSRRREEDLDFPPGRHPPADLTRERQRLQEDIDRNQRLDRRSVQVTDARRQAESRDKADAERARRPEPPPLQPMGSVLMRYVAQESKRPDASSAIPGRPRRGGSRARPGDPHRAQPRSQGASRPAVRPAPARSYAGVSGESEEDAWQ